MSTFRPQMRFLRQPRRLALVGAFVASLALCAPAAAVPQFVLTWGSNGPGDNQFQSPSGISTDAAGLVYVADQVNARVKKFSPVGDFLATTPSGQFGSPRGVAAAAGNVFVSDSVNNVVQKLRSSDLGFVTSWNGLPAAPQAIDFPADLAADAAGNLYVAVRTPPRIMKFSSDGVFLMQWTAVGTPTGVAVEPTGNILVTDQTLDSVQRYTNTGGALTGFGGQGSIPGLFESPAGIATDAVGNIYVADAGNHRIQKLSPSGTPIATWGVAGALNGQFSAPLGVTVDLAGNIYVADTANHRIQKFVEAADLAAAAPASVATTVGSTVTLSVSGANAGPGVAFLSTLNVAVPAGVAIQAATPTQGTCTVATTTASCALGPVAAAAAPAVTLTLRANAPVSGNSVVTLATPTVDGTASNNAASGQIVVSPAPVSTPPPSGGPPPPPRRLSAELRFRAGIGASGARFLGLSVLRAPKGARVAVSCAKGCSLKSRRAATGKRMDLFGLVRRKTFRVGAVIEVRVTLPGATGQLFRLRIARRSIARTECRLRAATGKPFSCAKN